MISKFRKIFRSETGFTLIELLVVIAVLGILASIAVPRLTGVQDKARLTEATTAIGTIRSAMEMYYVEKNTYNHQDDTMNAKIDSNHPIKEYLDINSLPSEWDFYINDANDSTYKIIANGTGKNDKLGAYLEQGGDVKTSRNVESESEWPVLPSSSED